MIEQRREPQNNDPCTISIGSDCYPGTIFALRRFVSGAKKGLVREIHVTEDDARIISGNGFDGSAEYEYTRNNDGRIWVFKRDANSNFRDGSYRCTVGHRRKYRDPSF